MNQWILKSLWLHKSLFLTSYFLLYALPTELLCKKRHGQMLDLLDNS